MNQYMKFIAVIMAAGTMASCTKNYVELEAGDYDFKSNPYTLSVAEATFTSPRQISLYNNEVETRGDNRICDLTTAFVDNSISNTWAILPPVKQKATKSTSKKSRKTKTKKQSGSTSDPASRPPIIDKIDRYPKFNSPMAVNLWKMMRRSDQFTQTDISNAIELCIVAYDYLSQEYEQILEHNYSEAKRRDCLVDLDNGKGSEIINFTNIFSRRLNKLPELSEANLSRLQTMNSKKEHSRELLNRVIQP